MSRISEKKTINFPEIFEQNIDNYYEIIDSLQSKYQAVNGSDYAKLVNFSSNKNLAKHNWYEYKQGYAEKLVSNIIEKENPSKDSYILDPFCGVGTTNIVAQSFGYKSIGYDINPVAHLAASVKTSFYSAKEVKNIEHLIWYFQPASPSPIPVHAKVIDSSFVPEILQKLYRVKGFYESIEDLKIRSFFRLAYLSIIEDCSIRIKDGNGIKLKKNKKYVEDVYNYYLSKCKNMLSDIKNINSKIEAKLYNTSLILPHQQLQIPKESIGLCIYSPPYANCFDYCEVYKLELWLGEFVKDYSDFWNYRSMAMRSHVNSKFDHSIKNYMREVDTIATVISSFNIWNKNIPDMLRGYFDDTFKLLSKIKPFLKKNAKIYIVVANSAYKGVLVPTDLLISEIAERLGYEVNTIFKARKIRASSQQIPELKQRYTDLMRESIIELENV